MTSPGTGAETGYGAAAASAASGGGFVSIGLHPDQSRRASEMVPRFQPRLPTLLWSRFGLNLVLLLDSLKVSNSSLIWDLDLYVEGSGVH